MSASATQAINLVTKPALFDDRWQPRVTVQVNDYRFKLAKAKSDFVWRSHADTDETLTVLAGRLRIGFHSGATHLGPGKIYVVPRGMEHKPLAEGEVRMSLVGPCSARNIGDQGGERAAVNNL